MRPVVTNAAWLRRAVMTHNVLTALKRLALPEKWLTARPKRMRFQQKRGFLSEKCNAS